MTMPVNDNPDADDTKESGTGTGIDTSQLGEQATAVGAELGSARLGGQDGVGTLQVVRGNNREVVEISGTWRAKDPASDSGALSSLYEAFEAGDTVQYDGPLADPESDRDRVSVEVEFTSSNRYDYDAEEEDEADESRRRVFNFQPVGGKKALDV